METIIKELINEDDPFAASMLIIVVSRQISENFRLPELDERKFSSIVFGLILDYFDERADGKDGILRCIDIMHKTAKSQLEERGMYV